MKQYLSPEQTAKLIELGFEKPKNTQYIQRVKARNLYSPFIEFGEPEFEGSYSIGELIEMLKPIKNLRISMDNSYNGLEDLIVKKLVGNKWEILFGDVGKNLIDLLFSAIVKLKTEGVI